METTSDLTEKVILERFSWNLSTQCQLVDLWKKKGVNDQWRRFVVLEQIVQEEGVSFLLEGRLFGDQYVVRDGLGQKIADQGDSEVGN